MQFLRVMEKKPMAGATAASSLAEMALDQLPLAVFVLDAKRRVVTANHAAITCRGDLELQRERALLAVLHDAGHEAVQLLGEFAVQRAAFVFP